MATPRCASRRSRSPIGSSTTRAAVQMGRNLDPEGEHGLQPHQRRLTDRLRPRPSTRPRPSPTRLHPQRQEPGRFHTAWGSMPARQSLFPKMAGYYDYPRSLAVDLTKAGFAPPVTPGYLEFFSAMNTAVKDIALGAASRTGCTRSPRRSTACSRRTRSSIVQAVAPDTSYERQAGGAVKDAGDLTPSTPVVAPEDRRPGCGDAVPAADVRRPASLSLVAARRRVPEQHAALQPAQPERGRLHRAGQLRQPVL